MTTNSDDADAAAVAAAVPSGEIVKISGPGYYRREMRKRWWRQQPPALGWCLCALAFPAGRPCKRTTGRLSSRTQPSLPDATNHRTTAVVSMSCQMRTMTPKRTPMKKAMMMMMTRRMVAVVVYSSSSRSQSLLTHAETANQMAKDRYQKEQPIQGSLTIAQQHKEFDFAKGKTVPFPPRPILDTHTHSPISVSLTLFLLVFLQRNTFPSSYRRRHLYRLTRAPAHTSRTQESKKDALPANGANGAK